jgi:hypothetical protein
MTTTSDHPLRAGLGLWSYTVCALAVKQLYLGYAVQSGSPDNPFQSLLRDPNLLASAIGGALVASGWTLLLPFGPRVLALAVTNLLVSALMVADYFYLEHVGSLISLREVLQRPDTIGTIADSILAGLRPGYILYFIDALVIVVAARSRGPAAGSQSMIPRVLAGAAATLVGVMLIAPTLDNPADRQTNGDAPRQSWPSLGVVPYHLLELIHGHSRSSLLNASSGQTIRIRLAQRPRARPAPAPLDAAPAEVPEIDQDGLVFREGPDLGRMRLDLEQIAPFMIDCGALASSREVNCDERRRLQTADALLDLSGRSLNARQAQRLAHPSERRH